ncbi:MAG: extracellular solute-binding protein [Nocardioidaceae bacterium]
MRPDKPFSKGLAAAAVVALMTSACSVTGADSDSGSAGSGTGTINVLLMKQAGYSEDDIAKMVSSFEDRNPDIDVETTLVSFEALHDKIVTSAAAGTYDVVLTDVIWPAEFASKGLIEDVTERIPDSWTDDMFAGALNTAEYNGKYYGAPWGPSTKLFYYNTAMLEKVGATPADVKTWDGVLDVARKLKDAGVKYPISWSWAQAEALICDYAQLLGAFGGEFTDDEGNLVINNEAGVKTLTWMKKTIDEGLTNPASTTFLEDDVSKTMAQGETAFSLNWGSTYRDLTDPSISQITDDVGVSATPAGPSGERPGVNGTMALSITSTSDNQDAAWTFIEDVTSAHVQEQYVESSLPNWKASLEKPKVLDVNRPVFEASEVAFEDSILRPQVPDYTGVSTAIQVELQKALLGEKSPQDALDDAVAAAEELK